MPQVVQKCCGNGLRIFPCLLGLLCALQGMAQLTDSFSPVLGHTSGEQEVGNIVQAEGRGNSDKKVANAR